jgi:exonuclease SbcC
MIKSLHIRNFQSHKDTNLEFDPGVNIIVGATDTGKTAILRALRWLIWNRPVGEEFRSAWGGSTHVSAMVDDKEVTRFRNNIENGYRLGTQTNFKAMGTEVPEEVMKWLNINEINLQQQLDSPFLLSSSPGEVAQHFNRVARLDKIDTGLQRVNSWIRELAQTMKYKTEDLQRLDEEVKQYDYLDKMEVEVEVLEELEKRFTTKGQSIIKLHNLIKWVEDKDAEIKEASKILVIEKPLNAVLDMFEHKRSIQEDISMLSSQINDLEGLENSIKGFNEAIQIEKPLNAVLELHANKKLIDASFQSLKMLLFEVERTVKKIAETGLKHERVKREFDDKFPVVCPLCGKPK